MNSNTQAPKLRKSTVCHNSPKDNKLAVSGNSEKCLKGKSNA